MRTNLAGASFYTASVVSGRDQSRRKQTFIAIADAHLKALTDRGLLACERCEDEEEMEELG